MKPIVEGVERVSERTRVPVKTAVTVAGMLAGLAAVLLSLRNRS
jgi:hypothetical protein